jgi:hypothetical protein
MKKVCQISIWGDALQYEPLPYLKFSDYPFSVKASIFEKVLLVEVVFKLAL